MSRYELARRALPDPRALSNEGNFVLRGWRVLRQPRHAGDDRQGWEEGPRYGSAIRWVFRTVHERVVLGGEELPAGSRIIVGLESANLDEDAFGSDAGEFNLNRPDARRHLPFGHGIHLCLGAGLVRLEISACSARCWTG